MTTNGEQGVESRAPTVSEAEALPEGATLVDPALVAATAFTYTYTTGPFALPANSQHIDWVILNNDTTSQTVRVTVFTCPIGAVKQAFGPLDVTIPPGQTTHNANAANAGLLYEIQIQANSASIFPYASAWGAAQAEPLPGSVVKSAEFIRRP
jgi:hypothetical protein